MAALVLTAAQVLLEAVDVTGFTGEIKTSPLKITEVNGDNMGAGGFGVVLAGVSRGAVDLDGFADFAPTGITSLFTQAALGAQYSLAVNPLGGVAVGEYSFFTRGILSTYTPWAGAIDAAAKFQMHLASDTVFVDGVVGAPLAARSTTFTGAPVQLGAPTLTDLVRGLMVCSVAAGTNLVVKIQSSPTSGGAYTDRLTFSTVSAAGKLFASAAQAAVTDTWWRVTATIGSGSFTFFCGMGFA